MMGQESGFQPKLFYHQINLEQRIPKNHILRKIQAKIDFDFIYAEVRGSYGDNGNVSIPPPVILKMILLLILYNVRSERELMETIPLRLDWLWFLGYDLDNEVPDHSVLSKARARWGVEAFRNFFERIVWQCVEAGLVDGSKIFVDASLVDADASNNSVVDRQSLKRYLNRGYMELERRLEGEGEPLEDFQEGARRRYLSTTDPDASVVRREGKRAKPRYQVHRAVDPSFEVITATEITPGEVNEAHRMISLMESHQENTGVKAETVVADSKYGTIENLLACYDRGVRPHIPDLKKTQESQDSRRGVFSEVYFIYDPETDTYECPGGKRLKPRKLHKERQSIDYAASKKDCVGCELRFQCTRNKNGRTIKRHLRQEELNRMRKVSETAMARRDLRTRQHLMERSYARAAGYGLGRARWRRLWRVRIQEYITAALQNIQVLIKYGKDPMRRWVITLPLLLKRGREGTPWSEFLLKLFLGPILKIRKYEISYCHPSA